MSILSVNNLFSGYGDIAVINGISLTLRDGEFLGIFGHNGMGKSTLLKTIAGLVPSKAGSVEFNGDDVTKLPVAKRSRKGLGYVPQGRQIYPNLSGHDNLKVAALGAGTKAIEIDRIVSLLPRIEPLLGRLGGVMSGGEQQILALGRCLIGNPKVILLDEPTEGIQPSIRGEMIETLKKVRSETPISIILVEQNIEFIRSLSDRIVAIQKGKIIAEILDTSSSELENLEL